MEACEMVPRQSPKILVVAEEDALQKTLKARLETDGCRVLQAFTWHSAVDFFSSERPDAVILDADFGHTASDINGMDLIRFIKKSRHYPAPLVVYGEPEDHLHAETYAATTFVPKPSPVDELSAALIRMLGDGG
ncbi:MAG: hypothetical protein A3G34_09825 [Candidatus Lindowbacteria bacterium RIFCSPLOWO2_12_FULL_62_27]|nr:MAG: hypothetical protein A3G34_09825 [Candidatus Lindowbacteria bacterium RIFCSPLOWO2_12_FULL_62_27]OGH61542.1 MAG: hypothetical protein A3I06_02830 [Candidatus Lindowbacteria bacterium RIFCSPLOWO2_02_FULL_62_12]